MSAADVTPAFVAELRKTHEGKQSKLREHHPRGSWAWLALDILDLCDAIESAWAELDRLRAQVGEEPPHGFEVSVYAAIHNPGMLHGLPKICKRGPGAWAAFVDDTSCIGKDGQVHYEPRPSNRTPEFIALTRFDTPYEAADALSAQPTNETRG